MADADSTNEKREVIYRHSGAVRVTHWVNVLALLVLLMSGLQIFNAHPALYFGAKSTFDDPVLAMRPMSGEDLVGVTTIAARTSTRPACSASRMRRTARGPRLSLSVTLPGYRDLATGRRWHFFFAWLFVINGLVYLIASLLSRHVRRDLVPSGVSSAHRRSICDHVRLRFPRRRGQALQRPAEAHLSRRDLRAAAAGRAHRPHHVAGDGRAFPGWSRCSAAGRRRGPSTSSAAAASCSSSSSTW